MAEHDETNAEKNLEPARDQPEPDKASEMDWEAVGHSIAARYLTVMAGLGD